MLKQIALFILLYSTTIAFAQDDCSCQKEFDFVAQYIEQNLPGFRDNVTSENEQAYAIFKQKLADQTLTSSDKNECAKLLIRYVEYFKDNHTSLSTGSGQRIDETNTAEVEKFKQSEVFQGCEIITLTSNQMAQRSLDEIIGHYHTKDSTYSVAVIPCESSHRDYVGVITHSKSPLWEVGQVKFELIKKGENTFDGFFYYRNHSMHFFPNIEYKNGILGDGWIKSGFKNLADHSTNKNYSIEFKQLDDSTTYLRIPTFNGNLYAKLDSAYKAASPEIVKHPYLIIDVRDNGGGSDKCVLPLVDYLYTDTIVESEKVYYYTTPSIIHQYEKWLADMRKDTLNFSKYDTDDMAEGIEKMKQAPKNSLIPMGESNDTIIRKPINSIKKVAVLYNRNCASSCETLLMLAKHSDKTILCGENSGGYMGYGNIYSVKTPCFNFSLNISSTLYENSRKYEVVGITPHYPLKYDQDWIEQTQKIMRQPN